MKAKLDTDKEIFIRVEWKSYVNDERDAFCLSGILAEEDTACQFRPVGEVYVQGGAGVPARMQGNTP